MTQDEIMKLVRSKDGFIGNAMNIPHDRQNKTHELVVAYNQTSPADTKRGQDLLKQILGTYNERVVIQHGVHFDFGLNTHLLGMTYVNFGVTFLDTSPITIGDMCFIAPGVILTCAGLPVVAEQKDQGIETSKPITIGNSVG
jgi:maltose O-acetyltransferase